MKIKQLGFLGVATVTLASILLITLSIGAQQPRTADVTASSAPTNRERGDSMVLNRKPPTLPGQLTPSPDLSGWHRWTALSDLFSVEFPHDVTIASDDAGGCQLIIFEMPEVSRGSTGWAHIKLYPLPSQCGVRIFNSLEAQTGSTIEALSLNGGEVLMVDNATDGTGAGLARVRAFYRESEFVIVVYDELVGIPGSDVRTITDSILSTLSSPEQ